MTFILISYVCLQTFFSSSSFYDLYEKEVNDWSWTSHFQSGETELPFSLISLKLKVSFVQASRWRQYRFLAVCVCVRAVVHIMPFDLFSIQRADITQEQETQKKVSAAKDRCILISLIS